MKSTKTDVIIVGGGVMGLLTARELALQGMKVLLLEKNFLGQESSWAGGGILSPLTPWLTPKSIQVLAKYSLESYPMLIETLLAETGIDAELTKSGLLFLDEPSQIALLGWAQPDKEPIEILDARALQASEPLVSTAIQRAVKLPQVMQVRNPRFLQALRASLAQFPQISICEKVDVQRLIIEKNSVTGVQCNTQSFYAKSIILNAGAWTQQLLVPHGIVLPIFPIKGQMILCRMPEGMIRHMMIYQGYYVIPRRDGHVLMGSTLENSGFEKTLDKSSRLMIQSTLYQALPGLAEFEPVRVFAGLRPGTPDGIPFIGPVPDLPGLFVNAGHYRNGLLLAPASARLMTNLVLGQLPIVDPSFYQVEC